MSLYLLTPRLGRESLTVTAGGATGGVVPVTVGRKTRPAKSDISAIVVSCSIFQGVPPVWFSPGTKFTAKFSEGRSRRH